MKEKKYIYFALLTQLLLSYGSPCFFRNNFNHKFLLNPRWRLRKFDWSTSQTCKFANEMQLISGLIYKQDIFIHVQTAKGFPEEGEDRFYSFRSLQTFSCPNLHLNQDECLPPKKNFNDPEHSLSLNQCLDIVQQCWGIYHFLGRVLPHANSTTCNLSLCK